jgi:hypothetical protein
MVCAQLLAVPVPPINSYREGSVRQTALTLCPRAVTTCPGPSPRAPGAVTTCPGRDCVPPGPSLRAPGRHYVLRALTTYRGHHGENALSAIGADGGAGLASALRPFIGIAANECGVLGFRIGRAAGGKGQAPAPPPVGSDKGLQSAPRRVALEIPIKSDPLCAVP